MKKKPRDAHIRCQADGDRPFFFLSGCQTKIYAKQWRRSRQMDSLSAQAERREPADDLVAEAMACVAWDGTVDLDRLVSIELGHDEMATRRAIDRFVMCIHTSTHDINSWGHCMTIEGATSGSRAMMRAETSILVWRRDARWHIDGRHGDVPLTDASLALYSAVCARHRRFSMQAQSLSMTEHACTPVTHCLAWGDMWMSRIAHALASVSGAWTGDQVMRTQRLARALLGLLRVRAAEGPLARHAESDGKEASLEPADAARTAKLCEANAIVASMSNNVVFTPTYPPSTRPASSSRNKTTVDSVAAKLLENTINATQRLYETLAFYTAVIAPSEYEALRQNTPLGSFQ